MYSTVRTMMLSGEILMEYPKFGTRRIGITAFPLVRNTYVPGTVVYGIYSNSARGICIVQQYNNFVEGMQLC
jgi:hypothetical protein